MVLTTLLWTAAPIQIQTHSTHQALTTFPNFLKLKSSVDVLTLVLKGEIKSEVYSRSLGLVATVAMGMAVIVSVGGGPAAKDVEWDVTRCRAKHHQLTLAQRKLVSTVTKGTLLQTEGRGEDRNQRIAPSQTQSEFFL